MILTNFISFKNARLFIRKNSLKYQGYCYRHIYNYNDYIYDSPTSDWEGKLSVTSFRLTRFIFKQAKLNLRVVL